LLAEAEPAGDESPSTDATLLLRLLP